MKLLNILFFNYYLFYKRILKDENPVLTAIFTLSFSISLLLNGVVNVALAHCLKQYLSKWVMISIFLGVFVLNCFYFLKNSKTNEIVKDRPMFFNNIKISMLLTILFFLITASFLFWEPVYSKNIIESR